MSRKKKAETPTGEHAERPPKNFREGDFPIHGDEKKADKLAMKAFGDSDHDGRPDVPHMPFPG